MVQVGSLDLQYHMFTPKIKSGKSDLIDKTDNNLQTRLSSFAMSWLKLKSKVRLGAQGLMEQQTACLTKQLNEYKVTFLQEFINQTTGKV